MAARGASGIPILSCALLRAENDALTVTTTNMEQELRIEIPAEVSRPGCVALSVDRLAAVLARAAGEHVKIDVDAKSVAAIDGGAFKSKLCGLGEKEWPRGFDVGPTVAKFDMADLAHCIDRVAPAMRQKSDRPVLMGACFQCDGGGKVVRAVATDGHRLHVQDTQSTSDEAFQFIIPLQAVHLVREVAAAGGVAAVTFTRNLVIVASGRRRVMSKLIEGNFPSVHSYLSDDSTSVLTAPREAFLDAIGAASVCAPDINLIAVESDKTGLSLKCSAPEVGETTARVEAEQEHERRFGVNYQYLTAVLEVLTGETVRFESDDPQTPVRFREEGFFACIMPMRLN
jgi:DNA polymerase-3 subunit beta